MNRLWASYNDKKIKGHFLITNIHKRCFVVNLYRLFQHEVYKKLTRFGEAWKRVSGFVFLVLKSF